jgi:hypothetical protein
VFTVAYVGTTKIETLHPEVAGLTCIEPRLLKCIVTEIYMGNKSMRSESCRDA